MTGAIGGFLPLDPGPPLGAGGRESVARRWFRGLPHHGYRNGRSALALGVGKALGPFGTLWMTGFACQALAEAAGAMLRLGHARRLAAYPLAPEGPLSPDPRFLAAHLAPGDAVLAVSYFGRPSSAALRRLAGLRQDVTWIEDRAGALWPGPAWGDALLYSPRKLLGVPDGGYLVITPRGAARARPLAEQQPGPSPTESPPALRRFEDESGNAAWFPAYRAEEAGMAVAPGAPSRLTAALLDRQDFHAIAAARRANHAALRPLVPPDLLLEPASDRPAWVPQGLPLQVPDASALSARMAEAGVFCPVMWPDPADPGPCARSRALANRVLLLPLDQRYGAEEMRRVASALAASIRGAAVSGTGSAAPLAA
ncbi:hypothetical protein VQH23_15210 [Pararoseomonas sp. SCSIO 73927]|uniref:hypothetical protein n=1 Tax=Pararoseomonas sp. SCSIO 73927 TaxID=3114537 RepID=UPI0030CCA9B9